MAKNKNNAAQGQLLKKAPLPKMPEGYYSGDKPNPNLRKFAEEHCTLYDPENDSYAVRKAFNSPVDVEKRKSPITDLHIYWSKKPPDAIREYIKHYSKPGDLVLDPFSGSGMTSMVCRELGRHSIAIDLSPAATFITKNYCTAVDAEAFRAECQRVLTAVKAKHG